MQYFLSTPWQPHRILFHQGTWPRSPPSSPPRQCPVKPSMLFLYLGQDFYWMSKLPHPPVGYQYNYSQIF